MLRPSRFEQNQPCLRYLDPHGNWSQINLVKPIIVLHKETFMTVPNKNQQQKTSPTHPSHAAEALKQKQKSEQNEVAGRHKNDGQKDHKGAR